MEKTVTLTIAPAAWCELAARELELTIRGAPCYSIEDLELEIRRGDAKLFAITEEGGRHVGYAALRVERYSRGAEGVIIAGAGRLEGAKLYENIVPALERLFIGVRSVRIESCRRGAAPKLLELGYEPTHAIFRKRVELVVGADDRLELLAAANTEALGGPDLRARPGKPHGGGGGSSSSSSSQTTNNVDRRLVADGGSIGISGDGSSVTVTTLDAGAINAAFDFAKSSDQVTAQTLQKALGVAASVFDKAAGSVDSSAKVVAAAYDNAKGEGDAKTVIYAGVAAVVVLVAIKVLAK